MTKHIISLAPEAGIRDVCEALLDQCVSFLLAIKGEHLQGEASKKHILRHFIK